MESLDNESLASNPLHIFFRTRLSLHDNFKKWVRTKAFGEDMVQGYLQAQKCAKRIKVAHRTLRGFEEYWGLYKLEKKLKKKIENFNSSPNTNSDDKPQLDYPMPFQGKWPYVMHHPNYKQGYSFPNQQTDFYIGSLKTGDMFLTRGKAFSSAAISRIGDVDNQFSHLALVWVDKEGTFELYDKKNEKYHPAKKGQVFLLESLLEGGVQVSIMKEWVDHDYARMVHLRYVGDGTQTEEELQKVRDKAAQMLWSRAKIPHGEPGHFNYNYSMVMNSLDPAGPMGLSTTLFCSQAIAFAYKIACEALDPETPNGAKICPRAHYTPKGRLYPFPMVYSQLPVNSNPLAKMLGITGKEVFAPADVEIDPHLQILAEWRNFAVIEGRRIHDMAMTKLFQWMERGDYDFNPNMPAYQKLAEVSEILVKGLKFMPPETPLGFIQGTGLMAFLMESPGVKEDAIDLVVEQVKSQDSKIIGQFLKNFGVEITEEKMQYAIDLVHPILLEMAESGQLKRFLNYRGFTSRLQSEAEDFRESKGFPPTDFVFDRSMEKLRIHYCKDFQSGTKVRIHDIFSENFEDRDQACSTDSADYKKGGRFDWRRIW